MRRLKDALHAHAAAATWAKEIPWVILGLRSQLREDTGLSRAEAIFGTPLVLPNEFLQAEEFSIDEISKNVFKILDARVFSLSSQHNSGLQLPEELPGDLLCAPLLGAPRWRHPTPAAVLQQPLCNPAPQSRSFTI